MGTGITDIIGGPHDFLPSRSDRSDEFQKLWIIDTTEPYYVEVKLTNDFTLSI